jgi:hypothetical protein
MATPVLPPEQINELSQLVAKYITSQRARYAAGSIPLTHSQKEALIGFFSDALLDEARAVLLDGERVAEPEFYPALRGIGFENLPDIQNMAAITFSDVIVFHVPVTLGLLFHELVHVEQYRQLGIPRFADLYIRGFLAGGGYFEIPLERCAYALGDHYENQPTAQFSVSEAIARDIAEKRF